MEVLVRCVRFYCVIWVVNADKGYLPGDVMLLHNRQWIGGTVCYNNWLFVLIGLAVHKVTQTTERCGNTVPLTPSGAQPQVVAEAFVRDPATCKRIRLQEDTDTAKGIWSV